LKAGLHSSPWADPKPGAHVARAAGTYMLGQIESGVYCPVAMTYGAVPTLRHAPAVAAEWLPRIFSREYDRRFRPARDKTSALVGMGMISDTFETSITWERFAEFHAGIMAIQALYDGHEMGHLVGDVPALLLVAGVLWYLSAQRQLRVASA
jgi:hypothetical protein